MNFLVIENNVQRALKFEKIGIETIFIDLEKLGKQNRQGHIDSVKSHHAISDIINIKSNLTTSQVLVRIDPINPNTKNQIDAVISAGADVIMLPFFKQKSELDIFFNLIQGRVRTKLLFEHIDALDLIEISHTEFNVDEVFFGLNDLSLSLGYSFMFEVLSNGILDFPTNYCVKNNIKFGIGGIGAYETGRIPGKVVMREYKRLGATETIISRGLVNLFNDDVFIFSDNLVKLRKEWLIFNADSSVLKENFELLKKLILK